MYGCIFPLGKHRIIDNDYSNVIFLQANYYFSNKKNEALMKHAPFFLIFEESALSFDILDFGKRVVRMSAFVLENSVELGSVPSKNFYDS